MALVGNDVFTFADYKSRTDADGKVQAICELLDRTDEMLDDVPWVTANLPDRDKTAVRAGLPTISHRRFNRGISATRSATAQVEFAMCQAAARTEVDYDLANLGGNVGAVRLSEARPHMSAMAQTVADTLIYGDPVANPTTDDDKIAGLGFYYKDNTTANTKDHVISASGSGSDNTSIWIIAWSPDTVCGIVPPGLPMGLQHRDLGEIDAFDASNRRFRAFADDYKWNYGLRLKDWRAVVRICNIKTSTLTKDASSGADLVDLMAQAMELLPNKSAGRPVFYCNRLIRSTLRRQIKNAKNVFIAMSEVAGKHVMMLDEVPVKRCDALLNTETTIS